MISGLAKRSNYINHIRSIKIKGIGTLRHNYKEISRSL